MIARWFWREWRSPSLLIVWLALSLAVACVLALGNISDRMEKGLSQQSREFMAGDRALRSSREVPQAWLEEAQKRGLEATSDYKAQMELARQTILIRELFVDFQKTNPVTDAEIQAEYDKFAAANAGKEYKASHILVEKEDEAKAIIAALKKGGKFEEIAKKQSKDPGSGARGGDLDWANPSSYVPEFTEALVKLEKGKLTQTPVKSQFGWHIIRLDDVREAQLPKIDEVKPQIAQQLQQQKLAKFQEDLRAKAKVE